MLIKMRGLSMFIHMHDLIIGQIEGFAEEARNAGNPRLFLERLSGQNGLHYVWHFRGGRNTFGFLLFHWHLCAKVRELGMNIVPLTAEDFSAGGRFHEPRLDWNTVMRPRIQSARSLEDLAQFSNTLEFWHNGIHGVLARGSGLPMGDGAINVLYQLFWNFHFFIDSLFEWQLQNYGASSGMQFNLISDIVQYIESQDHAIIARI